MVLFPLSPLFVFSSFSLSCGLSFAFCLSITVPFAASRGPCVSVALPLRRAYVSPALLGRPPPSPSCLGVFRVWLVCPAPLASFVSVSPCVRHPSSVRRFIPARCRLPPVWPSCALALHAPTHVQRAPPRCVRGAGPGAARTARSRLQSSQVRRCTTCPRSPSPRWCACCPSLFASCLGRLCPVAVALQS